MDQRAKEQKHLTEVYQQLLTRKKQLDHFLREKKATHIHELRQFGSDVRLNFDSLTDHLDTFAAIESKNREIDQMNLSLDTAEKERGSVKRLLDSPYFGKLIMHFADEEETESFYIGINGFTNNEKTGIIYDWRSPIAAVFYENSNGATAYTVNEQPIDVFVHGRWQFMIDHDQLLELFDTSVAIQDDVLLDALAKDQAQEMKAITTTIQQEQNTIIRDTTHQNILVHGVAGSGKTSVAMQRVAYLLYHHRQNITADDVMILTPNIGFTQYISQVLPSLGEKNPPVLTLDQLIGQLSNTPSQSERQAFSHKVKAPTKVEELLREHECISFLQQQAAKVADQCKITFLPLYYKKKVIISQETLRALYQETPTTSSLQDRLQGVKHKLQYLWQQRLKANAKTNMVQDQVRMLTEEQQQQMLGGLLFDEKPKTIQHAAYTLLKKKYLLIDQAIEDFKWLNQKDIAEDLFLHYSRNALHAKFDNQSIDHHLFYLVVRHLFIQKIPVPKVTYLLIDEVQDYTPAQIDFLLLLFPTASFTFVGDENQSIFQTAVSFDEIQAIFRQAKIPLYRYDMTTSYRSSSRITSLFATLQTKNNQLKISSVRPIGQSISYIDYISDAQLMLFIKNSMVPLTILTKYETDTIRLKKALHHSSKEPVITILPIYLAKGREFQHVLLYNVTDLQYHSALDKRLLYTAISRGTETLTITSNEAISALIKRKKPQL